MPRLPIGRMNQMVTIQRPDRERAASGAVKIEWEDVATVAAAVEFLTGNEAFQAQQVKSTVNCRVQIWPRSDVASDCQLLWKDKTLKIVSVLPQIDRPPHCLMLLCSLN